MTREYFARGYLLLISQSWGKAYRESTTTLTGEPSAAEIQAEFYYQSLSGVDGGAWLKACATHAAGDRWPSLDALKLTLKQCSAPTIPLLSQRSSPTNGITKDQFGLELYHAIETIGGILGLEQQRAAAIHYEHPDKMEDLVKRKRALQKSLAEQLPRLSNDEVDELLVKYPWITNPVGVA